MVKIIHNIITHVYRIEMIHLTSTLWVNPILIHIHTDDAQVDTCLASPRVPVHIQYTTFNLAHSYLLVLELWTDCSHTIITSSTSLMTLWKGVFEVDQKTVLEVIGLCIWGVMCAMQQIILVWTKQLSGTPSHKVIISWEHNNSLLHYWAWLYYTYNYV